MGSVVVVVITAKHYHRLPTDLATSSILVDLFEVVEVLFVHLGVDLFPSVGVDIIAFHYLDERSILVVSTELVDVLIGECTTSWRIRWLLAIGHPHRLTGERIKLFHRRCQLTTLSEARYDVDLASQVHHGVRGPGHTQPRDILTS